MQTIWSILKAFWQIINFIRQVIFNVLALSIILLIISGVGLWQLYNNDSSEKPLITQGALRLNLNGYLADQRPQPSIISSLKKLDEDNEEPEQLSTFDLIQTIRGAIANKKITGIVLELNRFQGGDIPSINALGEEIDKFKNSRHLPVIAVADNYSQSAYLLASYADKIYLNPVGSVNIHGLAQNNLYFKSLLNKLEITPHIFRVGTYKAAVEPFLRDNMSDAARENSAHWLNAMWNNYTDQVAKNRSIDSQSVLPKPAQYLLQLKQSNGDSAQYALKQKLVDQLATSAEVDKELTALFGDDDNTYSYQHTDYKDFLSTLPDITYSDADNKFVVISIEGEITNGVSTDTSTGAESVLKQLSEIEHNDTIKGIILRINSPGGSAFASEMIRQKLMEFKARHIPIVVSMGGTAASGGYWIASVADYIVANKNTLTGSIGIFGVMFTAEQGLKSIGINSDSVATSPFAQVSFNQNLPSIVGQSIQLSIEHGYQQFIKLVAKSRHMSVDQVDKIAQGQVWLGQDALKNGLVDKIGHFDDAVNYLSSKLNLPIVEGVTDVVWLTPSQTNSKITMLLKNIKASSAQAVLKNLGIPSVLTNQAKQPFGIIEQLNDPKGQYIYCLDCSVHN